jgi:hypothetical protein
MAFVVTPAKPGFWKNPWLQFYSLNTKPQVKNFSVYVSVYGCGVYKITYTKAVPIKPNKTFAFNKGGFLANGTFVKPKNAQGQVAFNNFLLSGCGYITGGPFDWNATWKNKSQPKAASRSGGEHIPSILSVPQFDVPFDGININPLR